MKCSYCNSEITFNDLNCPYCFKENFNYLNYDIINLYPNVLVKSIYFNNLFKENQYKRYLMKILLISFFILTFPLGFIFYCIVKKLIIIYKLKKFKNKLL